MDNPTESTNAAESAASETTPAGDPVAYCTAVNGGPPAPVTLHMIAMQPPCSSRLANFARHAFALVYPLALLASVVFLFDRFGPSGWLFVVLLAAVVLMLAAPKPPSAS